jgi:hypothetical protein
MMTGQCCTGEGALAPLVQRISGVTASVLLGAVLLVPPSARCAPLPGSPSRQARRLSSSRGVYARGDRGVLGVNPVL